jgi:hypothetical protein
VIAHTDPMTAALVHTTKDAVESALRARCQRSRNYGLNQNGDRPHARTVFHRNALDYSARLLRDVLPDAVAINAWES